ncbi:MAG: DNA mismatch repair protein MutS [Acidobacteriota bacterium]
MTSPHGEYEARLRARRAEQTRVEKSDALIAYARLAVFVAGAAIAWIVFVENAIASLWLALPLLAFVALVVWHGRVLEDLARIRRSVTFYERGIARLEDRWAGTGPTGERFAAADHPHAADLDLFGDGSLFQLVAAARTAAGEEALARILSAPARADDVRERQDAVRELTAKLDLREELALLGGDIPAASDGAILRVWAEEPPRVAGTAVRITAVLLSALALMALAGWLSGAASRAWFLGAVLVEMGFFLRERGRVGRIIGAVEKPGRDLKLLASVLARLERERFEAPLLRRLNEDLATGGVPPSGRIAALGRLVDLLDARKNQLFAPVAAILLWTVHLADAVEAWRLAHGRPALRWLSAAAELEALSSLAGYAYEHAADPYPEIAAGPCFVGAGLVHPLLPRQGSVGNDVRLDGEQRVIVVSGSNMSGKSTLLRTVGVNAVLAMAGAPVAARSLTLSPVAIGATLHIQDSLQAGRSRFFAEITRIRALVDLTAGPFPLLFLLDEVLHGTNSHDRVVGAESLVRGFIARGAIGLLTTHDLALAGVAETLAPRAANVHFEDHLEEGQIAFDYVLRPGMVKKSNALALMRSIGLDV